MSLDRSKRIRKRYVSIPAQAQPLPESRPPNGVAAVTCGVCGASMALKPMGKYGFRCRDEQQCNENVRNGDIPYDEAR